MKTQSAYKSVLISDFLSIRLEEKKKTRNSKAEIKDEKLLELQRRLEEKKSERINSQSNNRMCADALSANRTRALIKSKVRLGHCFVSIINRINIYACVINI